jgi:hypothetical protein
VESDRYESRCTVSTHTMLIHYTLFNALIYPLYSLSKEGRRDIDRQDHTACRSPNERHRSDSSTPPYDAVNIHSGQDARHGAILCLSTPQGRYDDTIAYRKADQPDSLQCSRPGTLISGISISLRFTTHIFGPCRHNTQTRGRRSLTRARSQAPGRGAQKGRERLSAKKT